MARVRRKPTPPKEEQQSAEDRYLVENMPAEALAGWEERKASVQPDPVSLTSGVTPFFTKPGLMPEFRSEREIVSSMPLPDARRLVEVGHEDSLWRGGVVYSFGVHGSIVRLSPPRGTEQQTIARVEAAMKEAGAVAVKVVQPPREVLPAPQREQIRSARSLGPRKLAMLQVEKVADPEEREQVRVELEAALGRAGL